MKRAPRSRQRHDLYAKYHDYDSEISDLLGECGVKQPRNANLANARIARSSKLDASAFPKLDMAVEVAQ